MVASNNTRKGKFFVKDKSKYRGNVDNLMYRSSWEKYIMEFLDGNSEVNWWSSEETIIPYFSNADGRKRRYFIDFTICWHSGEIHLWEVKPISQCKKPVPPSKMTVAAKKRFLNEIYTYTVNTDKWKTTVDICNKKGWKFKLITEDALKRLGFKGLEK